LELKTLYIGELVMASKNIKTIPHQSIPEHQNPQRELSDNEKIITHNIQYCPHQEHQNKFSTPSEVKNDQYMKMLTNTPRGDEQDSTLPITPFCRQGWQLIRNYKTLKGLKMSTIIENMQGTSVWFGASSSLYPPAELDYKQVMNKFIETENFGTTTVPDDTLWLIAAWYDNEGKGEVTSWVDDFFGERWVFEDGNFEQLDPEY
jgi:hypothetical protein